MVLNELTCSHKIYQDNDTRGFDDQTAQYREKLFPNGLQAASKGLIAIAATESLSIQHLGMRIRVVAAGMGVVTGFCSQSSLPPIVFVSALV